MPALPFNPVDLAPVFPDVLWAIGIAFVLALVTFRRPKPPTLDEAMAAMNPVEVTVVTENEDDDS